MQFLESRLAVGSQEFDDFSPNRTGKCTVDPAHVIVFLCHPESTEALLNALVQIDASAEHYPCWNPSISLGVFVRGVLSVKNRNARDGEHRDLSEPKSTAEQE